MATQYNSQSLAPKRQQPAKKCHCCQSLNAKYKATVPTKPVIEHLFCWRCSRQHTYSPKVLGYELEHKSIYPEPPADQLPKRSLRLDQYQTCYCCQKVYEKTFCTELNYECKDHRYTFCINCCQLHENCPVDTTPITIGASARKELIDETIDQPGSGKPEPFELA